MKINALVCLLFIATVSKAQLNTREKGVTLDFGYGATFHSIFNNINITEGSNALAKIIHLNLRFKNGPLGYGLKLERYDFVTANDSATRFQNARANLLQFNTSYDLVVKQKMSFYLASGIGAGNLYYDRIDSSGNVGHLVMEGFSASLYMGINYHPKGKFGIFVQGGFIYNVQHVVDYVINGISYEVLEQRPIKQVIYNLRGFDLKAGIRFAF
jgi:hypothetical protein